MGNFDHWVKLTATMRCGLDFCGFLPEYIVAVPQWTIITHCGKS